jgi:hypothetical protein
MKCASFTASLIAKSGNAAFLNKQPIKKPEGIELKLAQDTLPPRPRRSFSWILALSIISQYVVVVAGGISETEHQGSDAEAMD